MREDRCVNETLEQKKLSNGLELTIIDKSFIMVSDRWNVVIQIRVPVPVKEALEAHGKGGLAARAVELLGPEAVFEKRLERVFVDDKDKAATVEEFVRGFREGALAYLASPEFGARFVLRRLAEEEKRQNLEEMRRRHYGAAE